MKRTWIPIVLLLTAALAGCAGDDAADPDPDAGSPLTTGNETAPPTPVVTITNATASAVEGESITVNWTVETSGNASYALNETFLVWADYSVAEPVNASTYGNQTDAVTGELDDVFTQSFMPTGVNGTTVYLRAYALVEGVAAFSAETTVEVTPAAPDVTIHTVTIGSLGTGPVADYDPPVLQISAGEAVVWQNDDSVGHTATDRDGAWDTGTVGGGDASEPILFETAGTYAYACGIHATMVGGVIEVS